MFGAALALKQRLPSCGWPDFAISGGVMGYGVDFPDMFRHAATFFDKIPKGAKPTDLPIVMSALGHKRKKRDELAPSHVPPVRTTPCAILKAGRERSSATSGVQRREREGCPLLVRSKSFLFKRPAGRVGFLF